MDEVLGPEGVVVVEEVLGGVAEVGHLDVDQARSLAMNGLIRVFIVNESECGIMQKTVSGPKMVQHMSLCERNKMSTINESFVLV